MTVLLPQHQRLIPSFRLGQCTHSQSAQGVSVN